MHLNVIFLFFPFFKLFKPVSKEWCKISQYFWESSYLIHIFLYIIDLYYYLYFYIFIYMYFRYNHFFFNTILLKPVQVLEKGIALQITTE